ncbi:hypothetical protein [Nesterenkonia sp. K-15-9-6]|uniref:hypothetical protein n=1 Tax=Nesterenkonia sp. K-15-9-6 TaxID=3093918 RepID=UPI0040441E2C
MPEIKETPDRGIKSDTARQIIYIVGSAALKVAAVLGFIAEDQAEVILSAAVALAASFGFDLATANKPKRLPDCPHK